MTQPRGPLHLSGEEFIDPPPELAEGMGETFAQARARVAREEAERRIAEEAEEEE
jgi:hypothetical protein